MYLLDTNVVSALRRPNRHPVPTTWPKNRRPSDVYACTVAVKELDE